MAFLTALHVRTDPGGDFVLEFIEPDRFFKHLKANNLSS
jgi:hypothetical protein